MFFSPAPRAEKDAIFRIRRSRVFFRCRPPIAVVRPLLLSLGFVPVANAGLIYWGSLGFAENVDSRGRQWDDGYSMGAGYFANGFVPTFENREQWVDHWRLLGTAAYDSEEKRFAGVIDTEAVTVPVIAPVYFWAKNGDDLKKGPEWVLLTHSSWKWPGKTASATPAITWTTGANLLTLVIGEAGQRGKHLISRALRPVPVTKTKWLEKHFPNNAAAADPDADPDHDGLSNTLEYFLGTDPKVASAIAGPGIKHEGKSVKLDLQLNPYAESDYILEGSEDLETWFGIPHEPFTERPDLLETQVMKDVSKKALFFRFQLKPKGQAE